MCEFEEEERVNGENEACRLGRSSPLLLYKKACQGDVVKPRRWDADLRVALWYKVCMQYEWSDDEDDWTVSV